jgi:hypothetical protein
MTGQHGDVKLRFSGAGSTGDGPQVWDFTVAADDVPVDDDLLKAVPPSLAEMLKSLQLKGKVSFEFSKLRLDLTPARDKGTGGGVAAAIASANDTTAPAAILRPHPDVDFAVKLSTANATLDVGVPLSDVKGGLQVSGTSSEGKLARLAGRIEIDSLTLAERPVTKFRAEILKTPEHEQLTIGKIEAQIAKGSMAGQVDYAFSDTGPSRYAINLLLRNADVRELTGETEPDLAGQLSASLALEGTYEQPNSRRGRGDVAVAGKEMYRIPLILGLLQVTNLALPITSPFTEASARYSIDGARVTFEQIELRSKEMLMQGDGNLDFSTKQVKMSFVTDSRNWPKLPLIGDLLEGARHELLQIHVRGTLEEPKVSARAMNTITTTVDEVFKGDDKPTTQKRR